jgi:transposase
VISGIIYVIRHGLQWKDAPRGYGPSKTLYNRFIPWSRLGVFARIFAALAGAYDRPQRLMIGLTNFRQSTPALSLSVTHRTQTANGSNCELAALTCGATQGNARCA